MTNLLLKKALNSAIALDCIRKRLDEKNKSNITHKIESLNYEWAYSVEDEDTPVGQYCKKHWNDEQR